MSVIKPPRVALIAAVASINQAIGCKGRIPWHIPDDLKYFKKMTVGHRIIMGRKTWDSLNGPLPLRENVVVSRSLVLPAPMMVVRSVEEAIALPNPTPTQPVFVVGGAEIYRATLPMADDLYLTELCVTLPPDADCFFPEWNRDDYKEVSRVRRQTQPGEVKAFDYDFVHYARR